MKRTFLCALLPLFFLLLTSLSANAALAEDFTYEINSENQAVITGYHGTDTTVVIPREIGGRPVAVLAKRAFFENDQIQQVVFPDSVTKIGDYAFAGCINLSSVTLPDSIDAIGEFAFANCGLNSITLPSGLTCLADSVFLNCEYLTDVVLPENLMTIACFAFSNCTSLSSITLPKGVEIIDWNSFSNCKNLSSINISEGVTAIGSRAFMHCTALDNVTIPESVASIGEYAFCEEYIDADRNLICYRPLSGLTLEVYENSAAHLYAVKNNCPFVLIE